MVYGSRNFAKYLKFHVAWCWNRGVAKVLWVTELSKIPRVSCPIPNRHSRTPPRRPQHCSLPGCRQRAPPGIFRTAASPPHLPFLRGQRRRRMFDMARRNSTAWRLSSATSARTHAWFAMQDLDIHICWGCSERIFCVGPGERFFPYGTSEIFV